MSLMCLRSSSSFVNGYELMALPGFKVRYNWIDIVFKQSQLLFDLRLLRISVIFLINDLVANDLLPGFFYSIKVLSTNLLIIPLLLFSNAIITILYYY